MIFENWSLFGGFLHLPTFWQIVFLIGWTFAFTHLTLMSVTIYLHRYIAHRGIELHPALQHFFRFCLWYKTGMITGEWGAIHKEHHARVDTQGDTHSPVVENVQGFFGWCKWILWTGWNKYVTAKKDTKLIEKWKSGMPDDWIENNLYKKYKFLGVGVLLGLMNVTLFGLPGLLVWAAEAVCVPILAAGIINGVGHRFGYRNYEHGPRHPNVGSSSNILAIGVIIVGEELHNNHHARPWSPKFSHKPGEFDMGWMWLQVLFFLGLAKISPSGALLLKTNSPSTEEQG